MHIAVKTSLEAKQVLDFDSLLTGLFKCRKEPNATMNMCVHCGNPQSNRGDAAVYKRHENIRNSRALVYCAPPDTQASSKCLHKLMCAEVGSEILVVGSYPTYGHSLKPLTLTWFPSDVLDYNYSHP